MLRKYSKDLILSYFNSTSDYSVFVKSKIESYNDFIQYRLQNVVNKLPIIAINEEKKLLARVSFSKIIVNKPRVTGHKDEFEFPNECLNTNRSYNLMLRSKYKIELFETVNKNSLAGAKLIYSYSPEKAISLGYIPSMVMSRYCNLHGATKDKLESKFEDPYCLGAYFIVKGIEYRAIPYENKTPNKVYTNIDNKDKKTKYICWIQSMEYDSLKYPYYFELYNNSKNEIYYRLSTKKKNKNTFSLWVLFKALGVVSDKEMYDLIGNDSVPIADILKISLQNKIPDIKTKNDALLYIGKRFKEEGKGKGKVSTDEEIITRTYSKLVDEELFPHIGGNSTIKEKIIFIGLMARKLIRLMLGMEKPIDKEDFGNKRLKTDGIIYGELFRFHFNQGIVKPLHEALTKELDSYITSTSLDIKSKGNACDGFKDFMNKYLSVKALSGMETDIKLGESPSSGSSSVYAKKTGVFQQVTRKSRVDDIKMTSKMTFATKKNDKNDNIPLAIRKLNPTFWGRKGACDTPDGGSIGVQNNKCFFAEYTLQSSINLKLIVEKDEFLSKVCKSIVDIENPGEIYRSGKIYVDARLLYIYDKIYIKGIDHTLKKYREEGKINRTITIECDVENFDFLIYTDPGRILRPLLTVVKDEATGKSKLKITKDILEKVAKNQYTWNKLIEEGYIQYLDSHEERYSCYIALDQSYLDRPRDQHPFTHCEISPLALLTINEMLIPLIQYSYGPRNVFQLQMNPQAIGLYCYNYYARMDTEASVNENGQKPLVPTIGDQLTGLDRFPAGTNAIVAITISDGFNIEDSLIVNKRIEHKYAIFAFETKATALNSGNERFEKPDPNITANYKEFQSYANILPNGQPIVGSIVHRGDVIIGKVKILQQSSIKQGSGKSQEDRSEVWNEIDDGIVTKVISPLDSNGNRIMKVMVRVYRPIDVGDKLASIPSQKVTVSELRKEEDMPYTEDGLVPDFLFNQHGYITRMTISHQILMGLSLIAATLGIRIDGTAFNHFDIKRDIIDRYEKIGIKYKGKSICYDGVTGDRIKTLIFVAPLYYQILKHKVHDKVHARSTGYIVHKTKQPGRGRRKHGGYKIGHMEKDSILGHGAVAVMKEKFYDHSDAFTWYMSEETKIPCVGNSKDQIYKDKKESLKISKVHTPWMFLNMLYLMEAAGIHITFELK